MLKLLQAFIAGFMVSYQQDDKEGIGSVFQMLELAHTHFTLSDQSSTGRKGSKKSNSPKHDSKVINRTERNVVILKNSQLIKWSYSITCI